MAVRTILEYPDPRLREVAKPVETFDGALKTLVDDLAETMYDAGGVGLAATQVGVAQRVFVIDIAAEDEPSDLRVFVNLEFVEKDGQQVWEEGCLSFPGVSEEIKRAERVKIRALDENGDAFELDADGLMAVALQHENDHLDGVLMIDKLGALKKRMVGKKMAKRQRESASA